MVYNTNQRRVTTWRAYLPEPYSQNEEVRTNQLVIYMGCYCCQGQNQLRSDTLLFVFAIMN